MRWVKRVRWASTCLLGGAVLALLGACAPMNRSPAVSVDRVVVPPASPDALRLMSPGREWLPFALPGKRSTDYAWTGDREGAPVLHARADTSASMWRHRLRLEGGDLSRLRFSWQVPRLIEQADLSEGDTEDSPVRIVLAFEGPDERLSLRNRLMFDLAESLTGERPPYATLMYVWDNRAPVDSIITAARSDRIRKVVVESGPQRLSRWLRYERDVRADFIRAYGEAPGALIGVAVMTDSDNTRTRTEAFYGPIELAGRADAAAPALR
jgi:Protein of unknown function (DUF3047)